MNKKEQLLKRNENFEKSSRERNIMPLRYEVEELELILRRVKAETELRGYSIEYLRDGMVKALIQLEDIVIKKKEISLSEAFVTIKTEILGDIKITDKEYDEAKTEYNKIRRKPNDNQTKPPADISTE